MAKLNPGSEKSCHLDMYKMEVIVYNSFENTHNGY